ncbi:TPA: fimbrial biogenesis outer membrane usher protein [Escherichia coli]|nr:fimbrial biogenesis outer membrane usher protein [Escherichia coli]HAZ3680323.1 fimbrial biogenesis outer membrane usher protein [Escherichia coli]HAZ3906454.1 fimbrial biogenesis outer membrane usher protein [Escherichia coli]HBA7074208.1 fimbrial biogenesis outer membrane usher protein [Escherichia coli]HBA7189000.1 fimbrial biogenesis outer membrane usher protein [Escherichia coli]
MRKHHFILAPLILGIGTNVYAEDYFDPSLLASDVVGGSDIDLSVFSHSGGGMEGEQEVSIYVNNEFYSRKTLFFRNTSNRGLLPDFPPSFFSHLLTEEHFSFDKNKAISSYDFLSNVPYSEITFDQGSSRIDISIPQAYLDEGAKLISSPDTWDYGVPAFLVDYNISGSRNKSSNYNADSFYASSLLGVNLWGWRLRTNANYSQYQTSSSWGGIRSKNNNFYNTYIERDISYLRAALQIGQASTGGMILDSIPFRGLKLYSDDDMLGYRLRNYTPTVRGIARSQSVVTISQNGRQVYQTNVPPGPFQLDDFYLSGYSGDMIVTVREADGSEHSFVQPYSTLPEMKREGVSGFELSLGHYDNNGLERYYEKPAFVYGNWSRGFSHGITTFGEAVQSEKYQSLGLGSTVSLGTLGAASADMSVSRTEKFGGVKTGQSYGLKYSKSQVETGTTLTLATYRYSTKNFYSFRDFASKSENSRYIWENRLKNRLTLSVSQSLGEYGHLSLSAGQQSYWTSRELTRNYSLSHSFSWDDIYFNTMLSLDQLHNRHSERTENRQIDFYVSVPISKFFGNKDITSSSLTYNITNSNHRVRNNTTLNGRIPETDFQYRVGGSWGNDNIATNRAVSLSWAGDYTSASLGYTYSNDYSTLDYSLSGSAVAYPWGLALGNNGVTNNGAIVIETSGTPGVKTSAGYNTSVLGTALISSPQKYTENRVELYPDGLPDDTVLAETSKVAVPAKGAVVVLDYTVFKGSQVVFTLKQPSGKSLPFGTIVSLDGMPKGKENTGIVGEDGRVYMAGVPYKGSLKATWGSNTCSIKFRMDEQKSVGPIREATEVCK